MASRNERILARSKGKRPMEEETRVVSRKARGFTNSTLLTLEKEKRFLENFSKRKIVPGKNINFHEFPGLRLVEMFHKID